MAGVLLGEVLWFWTSKPNIAILFAIAADLLVGLLTFIKAFRHPETEIWIACAISILGFGLGILALPSFSFENAAFVVYVFALNAVLAVLASRRNANSRLHTEC